MTSLRVLYVCTGNICRSPMAERLLAARLPDGSGVEVASAGTHAVVGHGMDAPAALVTGELGGDPEGHVARQLDEAMIKAAGLVLTATVTHRAAALTLVPSAMHRTFTMREFARLGADATPEASTLRDRVAAISRRRGQLGPGADDIADPFGAGLSVMRACGDEVAETVDAALHALGLGARGDTRG